MVRVGFGKKILAGLVAAVAFAAAGTAAKAANVTISSNNVQENASGTFSSTLGATGTLTFSALTSTIFTVSETDTFGTVSRTFDPNNDNSTDGFLTSFTGTIHFIGTGSGIVVDTSFANLFNITVSNAAHGQVGSVNGSVDGGSFTLSGAHNNASITSSSSTSYSPNLGGVSIINFSFGQIPANVNGTNLQIVANGDGTAHFSVDSTIAGASNPTPLPAAAWGGLSLMGALGVGAMARRRRA